uniref:Uncharacterized protein n=1 Tax=Gopherus agassizii TaxID=38772 RepID=A0A452H0V7_9SAUR
LTIFNFLFYLQLLDEMATFMFFVFTGYKFCLASGILDVHKTQTGLVPIWLQSCSKVEQFSACVIGGYLDAYYKTVLHK